MFRLAEPAGSASAQRIPDEAGGVFVARVFWVTIAIFTRAPPDSAAAGVHAEHADAGFGRSDIG